MEFAEYPRLIEDPVKFWAQVIRPRIFGILEEDPQYGELRLAMANKVVSEKYIGMGTPELVEKYERTNIEAVALLSLALPYDYIADVFRSFTDICI